MPVAAVAGEPGGVEAQHGADLSSAQPRYEALKTGTGHRTAGGTAEIIVDHFDIAETPLPGDFDEVVYGGRGAGAEDIARARESWPRVFEETRR